MSRAVTASVVDVIVSLIIIYVIFGGFMKEKDEAKANSIGFDKCEWEVEEDDECERCGSKGVQLYFGNRDPLCSSDGDYWCIDCISKHIADNDAWVKECEEKWVDGGEAMAGALAGM